MMEIWPESRTPARAGCWAHVTAPKNVIVTLTCHAAFPRQSLALPVYVCFVHYLVPEDQKWPSVLLWRVCLKMFWQGYSACSAGMTSLISRTCYVAGHGEPTQGMFLLMWQPPLRRRSFRLGRQEDAHEYLVALLDAMHEACLAPLRPAPPREVAETSLIYRIFAGTSRSQVRRGGAAHRSVS